MSIDTSTPSAWNPAVTPFPIAGSSESTPVVLPPRALATTTGAMESVAVEISAAIACRRVLHVINGEHYSGAERVQDLLALNLPPFGYEVSFACIKPDHFPRQRQAIDAPLMKVPMHGRFDLLCGARLARIVRNGRYSLMHAHTPRTAMVACIASRLTGVPWIYHVHSPTQRDSTRRWINRINSLTERWSISHAAALITVSHSLKAYMQSLGIAENRLFVVPNGVPVAGVLRNCDSPRGKWMLGTVALFRPRKGTEVLLHAVAELRHRGFDVELRAIGPFETPAYEHFLRSKTAELEIERYVHWTCFTQNVAAELTSLDAFVLPSLFGEGLPMVVLEAMAAGVPVVATRVEGVPEAVADGVTGLLAEPGSSESLASRLAELMRGDISWPSLRAAARARHVANYSAQAMARGVAAVYDRVVQPF